MRWTIPLLALACVAAAPDAGTDRRGAFANLSPADLDAAVRSIAAAPTLAQRIEAASRPFLGTPYMESPLGEGWGADGDPRMRFDQVDCLTFVEMVIALVNSDSFLTAQMVLDDVRYADSAPAYADRNHLMESQWLPYNRKKGYLEDITREVGGAAVVVEKKIVTRSSWAARRMLKDLDLPPHRVPVGTFAVPVIPLDAASDLLDRIPHGTLLSVVRADHFTYPGRITHVGLVIAKKGQRFLRHGARSVYGRVVDEPLAKFLARNAAYAKWPVVGIHLERIRDNRERAAAVAGRRPSH